MYGLPASQLSHAGIPANNLTEVTKNFKNNLSDSLNNMLIF